MRLCTRKNGTRDGQLCVVSPDGQALRPVPGVPTLQALMDHWSTHLPAVQEAAQGPFDEPLDPAALHAPLPRAYAWIDGSAYINHIVLVRKARGAEPPATLRTDPLVYQGGSDSFLDPRAPIPLQDEAFGCDFESEVAVILGDVPQGVSRERALDYVRLIALVNDVSLRNLIPEELAKGFGFYVSKPSSALSPFAVTPDELGDAWRDGRVHLPLVTELNGARFGDPDAGPEMHFSFADLIAHCARTRPLTAGTIIGSGTVSNEDRSRGSSCLAEKRMLEIIDGGKATTPFLRVGDRVRITMHRDGRDLFGAIDQVVARYEPPAP